MNTKALKRLSLLAAAAALLYAALSASAFYRRQQLVQTLTYYGISEARQLELDNVSRWRRSLTSEAAISVLFALAAASVALGLFRGKRRAVRAWYLLVACFVAYHLFRLATSYDLEAVVIAGRVFEVFGSLLLAGLTAWIVYLNRRADYDAPPPPPAEWGGTPTTDT